MVRAGGNGSQVLSGLARLNRALLAVGHPGGLHVTTFDPDLVSNANVGRQLFCASDIGQSKAIVLTHRLNIAYGLDWEAVPQAYDWPVARRQFDLAITCVDSARARRHIFQILEKKAVGYWLDLGNQQQDGQVILGEVEERKKTAAPRLPHVVDIFPEILDLDFVEDNQPSCSLAEALEKQDLFVNQSVAPWALHLLWRLFRTGQIEHHGNFINLAMGRVNPLPVPRAQDQSTLKPVAA